MKPIVAYVNNVSSTNNFFVLLFKAFLRRREICIRRLVPKNFVRNPLPSKIPAFGPGNSDKNVTSVINQSEVLNRRWNIAPFDLTLTQSTKWSKGLLKSNLMLNLELLFFIVTKKLLFFPSRAIDITVLNG